MRVLIVDYGMGNLYSVRRAFEECGADVVVSDDPRELRSADHVVLPGVGAFGDGMGQLTERGWVPALRESVVADGIPFLGICLGMQLLAARGHEGGAMPGLGLIPGEVRRLSPVASAERIPHVGWNEVYATAQSPLFAEIRDGSDFYFVHSYHFAPQDASHVVATTPYCGGFVSGVASGNVYGVQFHPEKSSRPGFRLIRNFLRL